MAWNETAIPSIWLNSQATLLTDAEGKQGAGFGAHLGVNSQERLRDESYKGYNGSKNTEVRGKSFIPSGRMIDAINGKQPMFCVFLQFAVSN